MIYGNHNKKNGAIVKIARWNEKALLTSAWLLDMKSSPGP